jgi:hypothetical protein
MYPLLHILFAFMVDTVLCKLIIYIVMIVLFLSLSFKNILSGQSLVVLIASAFKHSNPRKYQNLIFQFKSFFLTLIKIGFIKMFKHIFNLIIYSSQKPCCSMIIHIYTIFYIEETVLLKEF